ncbi:class I SAM-dependent methyltransferase [Cytophagaceae bacterium DM2B3-1]|uniref:Class I SAM-dependent methyltransferase n=1 Tax=Xanthocytophaga flava TaxID=3048013 RepID=A0ABT7CV47_9BACT|nr:class I SAM-dependent methyltransferase [Xanthocytophaga flavus]MDJ1497643.1 class I SAM-dependent methyltransferase [Xanthocytophaga flavus]
METPSLAQHSPSDPSPIQHYIQYIQLLVDQGGPEPDEWGQVNEWIASVVKSYTNNEISKYQLEEIRAVLADAFSLETLQGYSFLKPHGYAGDYQIIDYMYTYHLSDNAMLRKWDLFYQGHDTVKAVRNRKDYFKQWVLNKVSSIRGERLSILNLASGPGRDIAELFTEHPGLPISITCVEMDTNAIKHAQSLIPKEADVEFIQCNIFKFEPTRSYDLIWSAGLFDYFNDEAFQLILSRLLSCIYSGGEIAIGNFQPNHGTYYYLEFVEWHLFQRTSTQLIELAKRCGVNQESIRIGSEPLGANLFLHIDLSC